MPRQISGNVIIITGASSGIGRATALALAREGCTLVLVARRENLLDALKAEVTSLGGRAISFPMDLNNRGEVERMISATTKLFGRIDVLINNAAFGYFGTVQNTPAAVIREIFSLNFEAALLACQCAIPVMASARKGHIINVSSIAGKRGLPLSGIYCATKFALHGISESMRIELKDSGIDVSVINPAGTVTEFHRNVRMGDVAGPFRPLGRSQSPETVARAIVHCIKRPKAEVYPYPISRLLVWINAVAPSLVDRVMTPYLRNRLRSRIEASGADPQ